MTLHASKGLEFPVVAVLGARQAVAGDFAVDRGECGEALTAEGVLVPRSGCETATQKCQPSAKSLNFAPVPTVLAHE